MPMKRSLVKFLVPVLFFSLPVWASTSEPPTGTWNFKVSLDDSPVGYHQFSVTGKDQTRKVSSKASFDVKLLVFNAYSYRHEAAESWQNNCLTRIKTQTDDNGALTELSGNLEPAGFKLFKQGSESSLPECVWTFAYWNPNLVEQKNLLNPQTGEYLKVDFKLRGEEKLKVGNKELNARHFFLNAGKFQIDLWYGAADGRWLALDSKLEGGRILHYRIE